MERYRFETLPLELEWEEERRRAGGARPQTRPRPRPQPRPTPRRPPRPWPRPAPFALAPMFIDRGPAPAEPGCSCPEPGEPAADAAADEFFAFETLELESPGSRPLLRRGSRGSSVVELQQRLANAGHAPGPIDGIFGSQTDAAVRAFQRARGLAVDGVVGPQTWGALLGTTPGPTPTPTPVPGGTCPRWVLPAAVRAAGDAQTVRYDDGPPWAGNPGNCTGFTEGARVLGDYIRANFAGVASIGGLSCRQNTATPSLTSIHGVGRALDIMITPIGGQANCAVGDRIANWLVTNAQAIGVQYVIWNRVRWAGHRAAGTKVADYTGPHPHHDHVHVEINNDAAARRTPWFAGR
jgi:hypothetical protein